MKRATRIWAGVNAVARHYETTPAHVLSRAAQVRYGADIGFARATSLGLFDPSLSRSQVRDHISLSEFQAVLTRFNPGTDHILFDKALFYGFCRGIGIPIPQLYAIVNKPVAWTPDQSVYRSDEDWQRFLGEVLPERFLVKPAGGDHGDGIRVYTRDGDQFVVDDEESMPVKGARDRMFDHDKYVVQQRVRSHPSIFELTGHHTAQCVRVVTVVQRDGAIRIWAVALRLVRSGGVTDNFHKGRSNNFFAVVDIDTGKVSHALASPPSQIGLEPAEMHPNTQQRFEGFEVPCYEEIIRLCTRAAPAFLPLRAIGWDIAVTPDGPVFLEGNALWGDQSSEGPFMRRQHLQQLAALA